MNIDETPEPRYCDHYGMLSYADFLTASKDGALAGYTISARSDGGDQA